MALRVKSLEGMFSVTGSAQKEMGHLERLREGKGKRGTWEERVDLLEDYDREGRDTVSPELSGKGCRAAGETGLEKEVGGF